LLILSVVLAWQTLGLLWLLTNQLLEAPLPSVPQGARFGRWRQSCLTLTHSGLLADF